VTYPLLKAASFDTFCLVVLCSGLPFRVFSGLAWTIFFCVVWFCCVRFSSLSTTPRDCLGRTSPKWPILWPVVVKP